MKIKLNFNGHIVEVGSIDYTHSGNCPSVKEIEQFFAVKDDNDDDVHIECTMIGFNFIEWSEFMMMFEVCEEGCADYKYYYVDTDNHRQVDVIEPMKNTEEDMYIKYSEMVLKKLKENRKSI